MKNLLAVCLLVVVSQALGKPKGDDLKPSLAELDPTVLPLNTVAVEGTTVVLQCGVLNPGNPHSLQWTEFAHTPNGGLISDNSQVVPGHPEAGRYRIINTQAGRYNLEISNVRLDDGGTYNCREAQSSPPLKYQHACALTVVQKAANCTTTIPASGVVLDGSYQVNDCILAYQGPIVPNITWSGPPHFTQGTVATSNSVWNGMQYNVNREMDTRAHQSTTFFTGYFLPPPGDYADNVPTYVQVHQSRQMFVYWGPQSMAASPIKIQYDAGDILTCTCDSWPPATFLWQNMRTGQITNGPTVRLDESWRGMNQTMRCEARNTIEATIYSQNHFIPVDIAPLTTPTTTTPSTTTTPPPPVSDCRELTGAWVSTSPTAASLCVRLDLANQGMLTGLLKNGTDSYWVDMVGRSQSNKFDQVGFSGIWPANVGVSSFIGVCQRCFGEEQILVNVVSRQKGAPCGTVGPTRYTTQYVFRRSSTLLCPNLPSLM